MRCDFDSIQLQFSLRFLWPKSHTRSYLGPMPISPQHVEVQGYTDCTPTNTKMLEKLEKTFQNKDCQFLKGNKNNCAGISGCHWLEFGTDMPVPVDRASLGAACKTTWMQMNERKVPWTKEILTCLLFSLCVAKSRKRTTNPECESMTLTCHCEFILLNLHGQSD